MAIQYAWTDWNWAAAEPEFQRTIELGPNFAEARAMYSHYLYMMKRPAEARAQIQRAMELDPLSDYVQSFYGVTLGFEHRFDEAVTQLRNVLKTNPGSPMGTGNLSDDLHLMRGYDDALAAEKARWSARGDSDIEAALTRGYAEGGYRGAMRQVADALAARSRVAGIQSIGVAKLYVRAGQTDRALDWLERAFEVRDPVMPYIGVAPIWDDLRGTPRFQNLLRRMNLPM